MVSFFIQSLEKHFPKNTLKLSKTFLYLMNCIISCNKMQNWTKFSILTSQYLMRKKLILFASLLLWMGVFSACNSKSSDTTILIESLNNSISLWNQGSHILTSSGIQLSAKLDIFDSILASGSLELSGFFYGIANTIQAGDLSIRFQEKDYENFNFLEFESQFPFLIRSPFIYANPQKLYISFGENNIQTKFIQLLTEWLIGSWTRIETPFYTQEIPQLQLPLFQRDLIQENILKDQEFENFFSQLWKNYQLISLQGNIKKNTLFITDLQFKQNNQYFSFSGSLENNILKGNLYNLTKDSYYTIWIKNAKKNKLEFKFESGGRQIFGTFIQEGETRNYQISFQKDQSKISMKAQIRPSSEGFELLSEPEDFVELGSYLQSVGLSN